MTMSSERTSTTPSVGSTAMPSTCRPRDTTGTRHDATGTPGDITGTPRRIVWALVVAATVLLLAAAVLFDDGAVRSIASPGSMLRLAMGVIALTLGGTLALVAVLEAWRPASAPAADGRPKGGADRECRPSA